MPKHHAARPRRSPAKSRNQSRCRHNTPAYPDSLTARLSQPVLPAPGMPPATPTECPDAPGVWHVF